MPELCRFNGIVIVMFVGDHPPPHFHVRYSGVEAEVGIESPRVLHGRLPARIEALVLRWASQRQVELRAAWARASRREPPGKIAPLS